MSERDPINVLFLTKYPPSGASSRYRVYQYLSALEKFGIRSTTQSFLSEEGYQDVFSDAPGWKRGATTLAAYVRRLGCVLSSGKYDLVCMQRELLPFGPLLLERYLKRRGIKMVFDYDDALFINKPSAVSAVATRLRNPERIKKIFSLVDAVVAGNSYLRDQAAEYCPRAYVLDVAEDLERITQRPEHTEREHVTLGWLGSRSTEKYLGLLTPVFQQFFERFPGARLLVVGGGRYNPPGIPLIHEPWSLEREVELLHRFDIGVMPLPLEEWSLGKCGGKARTYMAAGVPAVVTEIGYNRELIRNGETGVLAKDEAGWLASLTELAGNPARRQAIADAARRDVEIRFHPQEIASQMAGILREISNSA